MRFWDTSGVIKLLVQEADTERARELVAWDEQMAVWWCTPVECWSALARLRREELMSDDVLERAAANLDILRAAWYEVLPSEEVRRQARRLLRIHRLRASDALQLAAALVWVGTFEEGEFVCFDARLREAARNEGLLTVS
ncbi:MAG: type II toxin-antitoxin system VapC family toxin [Longimicrobiales bacterium]